MPDEVERLVAAAGKWGRYGARDRTLLLLMYRTACVSARQSAFGGTRWT